MPASRSARAMIFAPRSWPSRPGLATTTRIFAFDSVPIVVRTLRPCVRARSHVQLREPPEAAERRRERDRAEHLQAPRQAVEVDPLPPFRRCDAAQPGVG